MARFDCCTQGNSRVSWRGMLCVPVAGLARSYSEG